MIIQTDDIVLKNERVVKFIYAKTENFSKEQLCFEKMISQIVTGGPGKVEDVKANLRLLLRNKVGYTTGYASVAEFFSHVLLRSEGFEQYSCFNNLEGTGMKKGFDGLYKYNDYIWLEEVKSSNADNTHPALIRDAYNDLSDKVSGKMEDSLPWKNAQSHLATIFQEQGFNDEDLYNKVKSLHNEYVNKKFHTIDEFNIIPVSTLFVDNKQTVETIKEKIKKSNVLKQFKNMVVVCIDNGIYDDFIRYLGI